MNLALSPEVRRLIDERVKAGRYATAEDVEAKTDQTERQLEVPKAPAQDGREANESLGLSIGSCSLIGHVREFNDDAVAVKELPGATLLLIADGMGGKIGERVLGQIACARAFEVITRELGKDIPGAGTAK